MSEPRKTAADFDPQVMDLFDAYVHGRIARRDFLDRAARFAAASGTTAAGLLAALSPDFARAEKVPADDARLVAQTLRYPAPDGNGDGQAYVVRPKAAAGPLPAVVVVHENRGLNPHIRDVARRLALEGCVAVAPDALDPVGGYPGDEDKARALWSKLDDPLAREDMFAAARWARTLPGTNGKLGAVGFCWGGWVVNQMATRVPELNAGAAFYGPGAVSGVDKIRAELLIVFAEKDDFVNGTWAAYEAALKAAGVKHRADVYPGTVHGFHNDTTPRFNAAQAEIAWKRTLELFRRTLKA
jgi:carboxymethylenebutenolidase